MLRLIKITFVVFALSAGTAGAATRIVWMHGVRSPGTPSKYDKVGVIEVGSRTARNVLVLEPGTSAGGAYFVPLAKWIASTLPGWQVWSVERRENLLEDQSMLIRAKRHQINGQQLFNYYLGFLTDPSVKKHFQFISDSSVAFAKQWGLRVAVGDLHRVIRAAHRLGGKVVLGGHSLGGSVVTAYATWNFGGKPGASQLAGLVYIDGASFPAATAATATSELQKLLDPATSPWLTFGVFPAPFAGLFNSTGSLGALLEPNARSIGQQFSLLPSALKPPVPVTNLAQYGYALNVGTSPSYLVAAQAHLGKGVAAKGPIHGWNGAGALTPIKRFATMFAGIGLDGIDGTEWYFPERLTLDESAVGNGIPNPAQHVLGVKSVFGRKLPKRLRMYAFGAALGGEAVLARTKQLARQSHIPLSHLTLIDRHTTYAHNDPNGAYPRNAFFAHLVPFLRRLAR